MQARIARPEDAPRIEALIAQFVSNGTLLPRTAAFIEMHAHDFVVVDGTDADGRPAIVGCAHLDTYSPSIAELRSLAVSPAHHGQGIGSALVAGIERLARVRDFELLFAVSNDEAYFRRFGFAPAHIPELDRERSEVSKYKGVYLKSLRPAG